MANISSGYIIWVPYFISGHLVALETEDPDQRILPIFDQLYLLQLWVRRIAGGEAVDEIIPSPPLYPHMLLEVLEYAEDAGFRSVMLNPPYDSRIPGEHRPIEDLMDQCEDMIAGTQVHYEPN